MKKKSLRIVIGSLAVGGAERHLSFILPKLHALGWSIKIITLTPTQPADLSKLFVQSGIRVHAFPWVWSGSLGGIVRAVRLGINFLRLWKDFLFDRQSITHYFLPEAYLLGAMAATCACVQRPQLMSRRSLNLYQLKRPILRPLERYFHRKMTCVLGNSQAIIDELRELEGVLAKQLKLIYNGIPMNSNLLPARDQAALKKNVPYVIMMVANLIAYKGHEDLLRALALIKKELGSDWQMWMVGRDTGRMASLKDLARALGLGAHVRWLGARTDVDALYRQAHLAVLASHEEGFSNAILEAMACQLPLVVTNVGGNAEAVIHQENGWVVEKKSPQALAKAILWMFQHPQEAVSFGQKGYQRVLDHFSLDACVAQYDALYRSVLEAH